MCASLAHRHNFLENDSLPDSTESRTGRIHFVPDFSRIQSGSLGTDRQQVYFTNLTDVTHFLGIRDEDDYERILTKELVSESTHLLQVIGSLDISVPGASSTTASSDKNECGKKTTSANSCTSLRVFVGTSNHEVAEEEERPGNIQESGTRRKLGVSFRSFVFEQKCLHFSVDMNCYRTAWHSRPIEAPCNIIITNNYTGQIEEVGESGSEGISNITLSWARARGPSSSKWTADVQKLSDTFPGHVTLTIPIVFTSSRHNVKHISALLDKHV